MPTVDDLRRSNFITKSDVEPPILVTIAGYEKVNVAKEGAEEDERWALTFNELEKPWVLNVTNGQIISSIVGSGDLDEWTGAQIVLYVDPNIMFAGQLKGGIRVRAPKKKAMPDPAPPKPINEEDNIPF